MRQNYLLLKSYEAELKEYDSSLRLTMPDLIKAVSYSKLSDPDWHQEKCRELEERARK